jgi:hypothetical protein
MAGQDGVGAGGRHEADDAGHGPEQSADDRGNWIPFGVR